MILETFEKGNKKLELYLEQDIPCNPREDWDHLGKMLCNHRRYELGDEKLCTEDARGWNEALFYYCCFEIGLDDEDEQRRLWDEDSGCSPAVEDITGDFCFLPLYLYDHSGITMSTTPFSCPWDSGQVGWIIVSWEDVKNKVGDKTAVEVGEILKNEVKEYDYYLRGECYGFEIMSLDECDKCSTSRIDSIDGCTGFLGPIPENGILDAIDDTSPELRKMVEDYYC